MSALVLDHRTGHAGHIAARNLSKYIAGRCPNAGGRMRWSRSIPNTRRDDAGHQAREEYQREKARRARRESPEAELMAAARREYLALLEAEAAKGKGGRRPSMPRTICSSRWRSWRVCAALRSPTVFGGFLVSIGRASGYIETPSSPGSATCGSVKPYRGSSWRRVSCPP